MHTLIYSGDYDFQIIKLCLFKSRAHAWDEANEMSRNGTFAKYGIEHYDVAEFDDIPTLNNFIFHEGMESPSRKKNTKKQQRHPQKVF